VPRSADVTNCVPKELRGTISLKRKALYAVTYRLKPKRKLHRPGGLTFPAKTFPYPFYEEALCKGKIKKYKKRLIVIWRKMAFPLARVIWILTHPGEFLHPDDEIHHADNDRDNNHWENLLRVTRDQHKMLHWKPKDKKGKTV
jgi:hypothetical protein